MMMTKILIFLHNRHACLYEEKLLRKSLFSRNLLDPLSFLLLDLHDDEDDDDYDLDEYCDHDGYADYDLDEYCDHDDYDDYDVDDFYDLGDGDYYDNFHKSA